MVREPEKDITIDDRWGGPAGRDMDDGQLPADNSDPPEGYNSIELPEWNDYFNNLEWVQD